MDFNFNLKAQAGGYFCGARSIQLKGQGLRFAAKAEMKARASVITARSKFLVLIQRKLHRLSELCVRPELI